MVLQEAFVDAVHQGHWRTKRKDHTHVEHAHAVINTHIESVPFNFFLSHILTSSSLTMRFEELFSPCNLEFLNITFA